jgi:hypothetical protein
LSPFRTNIRPSPLNFTLERFTKLNAVFRKISGIFTTLHVSHPPPDAENKYKTYQENIFPLHFIELFSQIGTGGGSA